MDQRSEPIVLESCHSFWVFDPSRLLFRRMLKGLDFDASLASTSWRPYFRLDVERELGRFEVSLDPEGTRRLRARIHSGTCRWCGESATEELSASALAQALEP